MIGSQVRRSNQDLTSNHTHTLEGPAATLALCQGRDRSAARSAVTDNGSYVAYTPSQQLGIQVVAQEIDTAVDLPSAFAAIQRERAQAVVVQQNPITTDSARRMAEL